MKTNQEIVIHDMEFDNQTGAFEEVSKETAGNSGKKYQKIFSDAEMAEMMSRIMNSGNTKPGTYKINIEDERIWRPGHVGLYVGEKDKYQL